MIPPSTHPLTLDARVLQTATAAGGPLLCIDTSTSTGSVAVVHPTVGRIEELSLTGRALPCEALVDGLDQLLGRLSLRVADLRAIIVGVGPGSFTGLRIGMATVKGLAFGAGVSVYGVSSLALWAASAGPGLVAPVLDARRGAVFGALYEVDASGSVRPVLGDAVHMLPDWLELLRAHGPGRAVRLVGEQAAQGLVSLPDATCISDTPRASLAPLLCTAALLAGEGIPLARLVPHYLRESEAERQAAAKQQG